MILTTLNPTISLTVVASIARKVLSLEVASSGINLIAFRSSREILIVTMGPFAEEVVVLSENSRCVNSSDIVDTSGWNTMPEMLRELVFTVSENERTSC